MYKKLLYSFILMLSGLISNISKPAAQWKSLVGYFLPSAEKRLISAAQEGNSDQVRKLLNAGAVVDHRDQYGLTALAWAAGLGNEEVVQILLDEGAAVDHQDWHGRLPLSWAAKNGNEAIVRLLLEHDAVADCMDHWGNTPLIWAAYTGNEAIVRLLLEHGAVVNYQGRYRWSYIPLMCAAWNGEKEVVRMLLERGSDLPTDEAAIRLYIEQHENLETEYQLRKQSMMWGLINGHRGIAGQRAATTKQALESNKVPTDIAGLIWNIGDLPKKYRPSGSGKNRLPAAE